MRKTVQIADKIEKEFPNIDLLDDSKNRLEEYLNLLILWNKKINLTAIRDRDAIIIKHLLDSLVPLTINSVTSSNLLSSANVLDFGSGAGIPGIILAICIPEMNLISIDKSKKKIAFQNQVVRQLALNNVKSVQTRLQDFIENQENKLAYDVIISRAFDQIKNILHFGDQLLKPKGHFILWKGKKWREEMEDVENFVLKKYKSLLSHRYQFQEYDHGGVILLMQKL